MKTYLRASIVTVAFIAASLAGPPPFKPASPTERRQPETPIGRLGYRLGTYLTIEGVRDATGKGRNTTLVVDKIGDYKLEAPIRVQMERFILPETGRCVLKGFETGGWAGIPFGVQIATNAESANPLPITEIEVEQGPFQFVYSFRVLSVVQPTPTPTKDKP